MSLASALRRCVVSSAANSACRPVRVDGEHRPIQTRPVLADMRGMRCAVGIDEAPSNDGVAFPTLRPPRLGVFSGTGAVDEAWKTPCPCTCSGRAASGTVGHPPNGTSPQSNPSSDIRNRSPGDMETRSPLINGTAPTGLSTLCPRRRSPDNQVAVVKGWVAPSTTSPMAASRPCDPASRALFEVERQPSGVNIARIKLGPAPWTKRGKRRRCVLFEAGVVGSRGNRRQEHRPNQTRVGVEGVCRSPNGHPCVRLGIASVCPARNRLVSPKRGKPSSACYARLSCSAFKSPRCRSRTFSNINSVRLSRTSVGVGGRWTSMAMCIFASGSTSFGGSTGRGMR